MKDCDNILNVCEQRRRSDSPHSPAADIKLVSEGFQAQIQSMDPWWAESRTFFLTFPQDTPTGVGVTMIASEIREEDDYIANARSVEGVGIIGNRKHKASFFTRYTFADGRLKGAYVGGGYRYQGEMLVGRAADRSLLYAPAYGEASFLAGYNVRLKDRRRLSLQLNGSNLFDETDPIVTRYATSGNLHAPRRMIIREPRMTRLTANFSF